MKRIVLLAFVAVFAACGGDDKKAEKTPEGPLVQSKNSNSFSDAFSEVITNYYHIKDNLVLSNDTLADVSAKLLIQSTEKLKLNEIKADSNIISMAQSYVETIIAESKGLLGEKDLEGKRKSFQMISDNMYDLIRTVKYDKEVVYHQFCPMAFNDAGAYWLSRTAEITNPYFGKKMLTCGEVKDSLDFRAQ